MDLTAKSFSSIRIIGLSLIFFSGGVQVLLDVYPSAIFLSSYPPSWLSYYYFGTSILEISVGLLFTFIINKSNKIPAISLLICAVLTFTFIELMKAGFYYTPFIFALFLEGVS